MRQKLPKIGRQRFERQTPLARRRRHFRLMREIAQQAGLEAPNLAERAVLSRAATLHLTLEDAEHALIHGKRDDADQGERLSVTDLVKCNSELRRLMRELARNAEPQSAAPVPLRESAFVAGKRRR
jgi:hypothetical protein